MPPATNINGPIASAPLTPSPSPCSKSPSFASASSTSWLPSMASARITSSPPASSPPNPPAEDRIAAMAKGGGEDDDPARSGEPEPEPSSPLLSIPGSSGGFFSSIKDRLDFFWFQGETRFWSSRRLKYRSTIFRVNVPPSPPGFPISPVVMLLDQKSFPVLFDPAKVEKKDVLLANYMPSLSYYDGIRPCIYLDTTEERHAKIKAFVMESIKENASKWVPEMEKATAEIFPEWENELKQKGGCCGGAPVAQVNSRTAAVAANVLIRALIGVDPPESANAAACSSLPFLFNVWNGPQLAPIASAGIRPHAIEELLIHTFPLPPFLFSPFRRRLFRFFETNAAAFIDAAAARHGLDRRDVLANLVFFVGFNAYGGLNLFFPTMMAHVGAAGDAAQGKLAEEVRREVEAEGGRLTAAAVGRMELVKSAVMECLRLSPPVPYQYGRAREDLIVETHDGRYEVKKGEILGGCQPVACRDPVVFHKDPDSFVVDRFVGDGRNLLKYVLWGNGPGDVPASVNDKHCPAAQFVPFLAQTFLACLFLRYDSFVAPPPVVRGNSITVSLSALSPHVTPPVPT